MSDRRERFEALMLPHLDAAYNLARWLTRAGADADDIVQDAYLRAFRSFESFRGEDSKPWLLAIVRNCYLTRIRKSREHMSLSLTETLSGSEGASTNWAESLVATGNDPEQAALNSDTSRTLDDLLATLPDEYREVLVLREFEDLSYRDIASVTGAPIGTVMSRLARARALLRETWQRRKEGTDLDGVR
jgi:RNA polymerase sigma-70 factor (ECF subfamily)